MFRAYVGSLRVRPGRRDEVISILLDGRAGILLPVSLLRCQTGKFTNKELTVVGELGHAGLKDE